MAHQMEIKYMLGSLKVMQQKIGGPQAKKTLGSSEFEIIQEQFLSKRHEVEKWQQQKEREGVTTKNADIHYKIREGTQQLKQLLLKLKNQYDRLQSKKKETPQQLQMRLKVLQNCELLYTDIEDRLNGNPNAGNRNKYMTLTDMKAKLLNEIDDANHQINRQAGSEDRMSSINDQEIQAIEEYKRKDQQMDDILDEIIVGVGGLKKKVQNINQKQDEVNKKVVQGNKAMTKLENRIKTDNQKLKVIIQKMKPTRCCLAIFLLLLFVGLIVVIIKFLVPQ